MILVGLTGGLATGKSTVARMFQDCGAMLIDADLLARLVVEPDKPAWREIVRAFEKQILRPDRTLDRSALATIVFQNRTKLRQLGAIIHPRVAREQSRLTREVATLHSSGRFAPPWLTGASARRVGGSSWRNTSRGRSCRCWF